MAVEDLMRIKKWKSEDTSDEWKKINLKEIQKRLQG